MGEYHLFYINAALFLTDVLCSGVLVGILIELQIAIPVFSYLTLVWIVKSYDFRILRYHSAK